MWAVSIGGHESLAIGYGGDSVVSSAIGLSRITIRARHMSLESEQPGIKEALEKRVDPVTLGDPCSALRWTCKSRAKLTGSRVKARCWVSSTAIGRLLHELG